VVWEGAEVAVAPAVVAVTAGRPVVAGRLVEVAAREGAEVVSVGWVAEEAGRVPAGAGPPAPPEPLGLPAGGGRTSMYRMNTATKSRDSRTVEVRTRPWNRVAGSRPGGI
jgi:hypothetical protein